MAAAILSQDILAICLLSTDGDVDLSLEEVIHRVEEFEKVNNRHFGTSRSDFRVLFLMLVYLELGIKKLGDEIDDIRFIDIIADVLNYFDAHFNDEGEHWTRDEVRHNKEIDSRFIENWYGYDEKAYQEKLKVKKEMKRFFEQQKISTLNPESVRKFMGEIKVTDAVLYHCSRPGESS
jgi:hypothetical protein